MFEQGTVLLQFSNLRIFTLGIDHLSIPNLQPTYENPAILITCKNLPILHWFSAARYGAYCMPFVSLRLQDLSVVFSSLPPRHVIPCSPFHIVLVFGSHVLLRVGIPRGKRLRLKSPAFFVNTMAMMSYSTPAYRTQHADARNRCM